MSTDNSSTPAIAKNDGDSTSTLNLQNRQAQAQNKEQPASGTASTAPAPAEPAAATGGAATAVPQTSATATVGPVQYAPGQKFEADTPAASAASHPLTRTWPDLFEQVEKEALVRKEPAALTAQMLSVCREYLLVVGCVPEGPVDRNLLSRLRRALEQPEFAPELEAQASLLHVNPTVLRAALNTLVRNYVAIAETHFGQMLKASLRSAKLTYEELSARCGMSIEKIRFWIRDEYGGVTGMTAGQALRIDETTGAQGKVVASYAALTQDCAYETQSSVLDKLLGRVSFGARLLAFRIATRRPLRELLLELETVHGFQLCNSQLSQWEQGFYIPSADMADLIAALDKLYNAKGELIAAWRAEEPNPYPSRYCFSFEKWPARLQAQYRRLVAYKTTNPEGFSTSDAPNGDRWTKAAEAQFKDFCERYFGFLKKEKGLAEAEISLTLLCDWRLVHEFWDFLRKRNRRDTYTTYEHWRTTTLRNLYQYFFPELWEDAAEETRWQDLPVGAKQQIKKMPGVCRDESVNLETFEKWWRHFVALSRIKAATFLKGKGFTCTPFVARLQALLDSGGTLSDIRAEIEARIKQLPPRILSRKAAVLCRRLAEAALLVALNVRPGVLESLKCDQMSVRGVGEVHLAIPESELMNRGKAGGKGGLCGALDHWDYLGLVLRRYVEEARPILLGDAADRGDQDAGYFFIGAFSTCRGAQQEKLLPGGRMDPKVLYHDILATLGWNPWAERYLFYALASRKGLTSSEIAKATQTTIGNVEKTYAKIVASEEGQRTVARVLSRKKSS